jgi:Na+/proline symporter
MTATVVAALFTALSIYLFVGFFFGRRNRNLADLIPLTQGHQAEVKNSAEFSASTVATSISLATVVLAFFELAPKLGVWLFWTVMTTSIGLFCVRFVAKRIWEKLSAYDHRPTLHEFLGHEFNSRALYMIGAACTSLGFLGAFAVELTVGSRFLAGLLPDIPLWLAVVLLAFIGLAYTSYGGFRAVIVTDRIQMASIWTLLAALIGFYFYFVDKQNGWAFNLAKIPAHVNQFTWRADLPAFLLGVWVINVPTFISDMSVWQRIAASQKPETVYRGLFSSVIMSALSWGLFVAAACLAFMIITPAEDVNPLLTLLNSIGTMNGLVPMFVLFFVVLGLYGAMLSTASTQLIAVSHTVYEDLISQGRKLKERLDSAKELWISRMILIAAALLSMGVVVILSSIGFSIADFVFAIYGAQLGLFPSIVAALYGDRTKLEKMSRWAAASITFGFIAGWSTAGYGKYIVNDDLVFLAPVASLLISSLILGIGFIFSPKEKI